MTTPIRLHKAIEKFTHCNDLLAKSRFLLQSSILASSPPTFSKDGFKPALREWVFFLCYFFGRQDNDENLGPLYALKQISKAVSNAIRKRPLESVVKRTKAMAVVILLLGMTLSSVAWARGGGSHGGGSHGGGFHGGHGFHGSGGFHSGHFRRGASVGVIIGAPLLLPYYYPPYPQVGLVPNEPPIYIEQQGSNVPPNAQAAYWYYCNDPEGYFPNVGRCNGAWEQVTPQPPPSP